MNQEDMKLEEAFVRAYDNIKLSFYKRIFGRFETRDSTLSAVETFCVEVISALGTPTINEFAKFVKISQANATYKVQSLIEKGYVTKEQSREDKREFRLSVTDRYRQYNAISTGYVHEVVGRMRGRFSPQELQQMEKMLTIIADEIMPQVLEEI